MHAQLGVQAMSTCAAPSRTRNLVAVVAIILIAGCGNAQKDGLAADSVPAKAPAENPFYKNRLKGGGLTEADRETFKRLLPAAHSGDVHAQIQVGLLHVKEYKFDAAREWFRKASAAGSHEAQYYISLTLPEKERFADLRKAADMGNPEAQYEVAGRLALTDPQAAAKYLLMAAEGNYPLAQQAVAQRLDGTERYHQAATQAMQRDEARALYWYKRLAENPYADGVEGNDPWRRRAHALTAIGLLYFHGRGVRQDDRLAAEYLEKGIAGGSTSSSAYIALADLYLQGRGVTKDAQKANDLIKRSPRPRPQR